MIYKKYLLTGKNGRLNKTRPVHVYSPKRKTFTGQGGTGRQFLKVCPYKEAVAAIDLVTHGRTT